MNSKRVQVDIKANHKPVLQKLMKKLGGVSAADAIGFLIETQISAALARLEPTFGVSETVTRTVQPLPSIHEPASNPVTRQQQQQKTSDDNFSEQNEAANSLAMLLGN